MKNFIAGLFIVIGILGCGKTTTVTETSADPEAAASDATDLADLATSVGDLSNVARLDPNMRVFATTSRERVVNGDTGTVTIKWTREVDEDGLTRTRTLTFADYTKKGAVKLSHLDGILTYTFKLDMPTSSIIRTLKGSVTATRTNKDGTTEQVTLEPDFTYTRDPIQRCVHMNGFLMVNGQKHEFQNKDHCLGA